MSKRIPGLFIVLLTCLLMMTNPVFAQTTNMLDNPFADELADYWTAQGDAVIETVDGNPCFVLRNGGYFAQEIILPANAGGKYLLLAGLVSSDRIHTVGSITGLPYLYGYIMDRDSVMWATGQDINNYLEVSHLLSSRGISDEWTVMWGIFSVPEDTGNTVLFLKQAEQRGDPLDGSAARFDDLGVYLFSSVTEAQTFVSSRYYQ
jgi:hypothetical protein